MSGAAALKMTGASVSGLGEFKAQTENLKTREDLKRKIDYLSAIRAPFKQELMTGLAEGGALRKALAAAGQEEAARGVIDAGTMSRALGSRTSARARQLGIGAGRGGAAGYAGAEMGADTESSSMILQQLLEEMGYSALLGGKPAVNKMAPYAGVIQGAGDLYGDYRSERDRQDRAFEEEYGMTPEQFENEYYTYPEPEE